MKRALFLFLSLTLAVSCDRGSASSVAASAPVQALRVSGSGNLLQQIAAAPDVTRFAGARRWVVRVDIEGVAQESEYLEHVAADGQGGFAITPAGVVRPRMSAVQQQTFELMQKAREAFLYRYRDVRVRDVDRLLQNYTVDVPGTTTTVAGRPCDVVELRKRADARAHYVLAIDHDTRIVLRSEELGPDGALLARMEYQSFDPSADVSAVAMHQDLPATEIDPSASNEAVLGFALRRPALVHGFQLARADVLQYQQRTWARLQYHDGIEPLFFLQSGPTGGVPPATAGASRQPPVVKIFRSGAWTFASTSRGGYDYLVAGKISETDLVATLQSALE